MTKNLLTCAFLALSTACVTPVYAETNFGDTIRLLKTSHKSRLSVGGYGEVAMSKNFYSDSYLRYTDPTSTKGQTHGRFDLPHVVVYLGFDFGKGWTMGSEIEFEHGGTETAVEIETEEAGEYETETERGGEVALEQFWLQKSFTRAANIRVGMLVVPVGQTNANHMPTEFFGVYRPEGENTIFPCTWHDIGISFWGKSGDWRYEAMVLPGLDSERFGNQGWIHDGSASPYEFKIANCFAGAARVDNYSVPGLRLSISGYVGNSFRNTLYPTNNTKNKGVRGTVAIGSFDFQYKGYGFLARGNFDYGHLTDSKRISDFNISMPKTSTSKRQKVASDVIATGVEAGYDFFGLNQRLAKSNQKFYVFGRYEYYDSMWKMESDTKEDWCGRQRIAAGINYYPMPQIVVKAEYSVGLLKSRYNNEPAISLGIAYSGWFL
jgi:hypothetical protein